MGIYTLGKLFFFSFLFWIDPHLIFCERGYDDTSKIIGVIPNDPNLFSIDTATNILTDKLPSKVYKPTRLKFNMTDAEIGKFRNMFSGFPKNFHLPFLSF